MKTRSLLLVLSVGLLSLGQVAGLQQVARSSGVDMFSQFPQSAPLKKSQLVAQHAANPTGRVNRLIQQLKADEPGHRSWAAESLGEMGKKATLAIPDLISLVEDQDYWVRIYSIRALGEIGAEAVPVDRKIVDHLTKTTKHDDQMVRGNAISALVKIVRTNPSALPDFVRLLESSERESVVRELQRMGTSAQAAIPLLESYLQVPSLSTDAAIVMGNMGASKRLFEKSG
jgi:HEAT repeat protein